MKDTDPGCETCRFWHQIVEADPEKKRESHGRCQRYPPVTVVLNPGKVSRAGGEYELKDMYPGTIGTPGMGCGEHKPE